MMRRAWSVLMVLLVSACSVFGVRAGTEEPAYSVIEKRGDFEIRRYPARIAIETVVGADEESARYQGFRRLAGYIFGDNKSRATIAMTAPVAQNSEKIAMTAPVAQDRDPSGHWRIQFFAPASYTLATMPIPIDPAVKIVEVPGNTYGVIRFTGSRSPAAIARETQILLKQFDGSGWKPTGSPFAWFYDPPWTLPFLRRNEVGVVAQPAP